MTAEMGNLAYGADGNAKANRSIYTASMKPDGGYLINGHAPDSAVSGVVCYRVALYRRVRNADGSYKAILGSGGRIKTDRLTFIMTSNLEHARAVYRLREKLNKNISWIDDADMRVEECAPPRPEYWNA